MSVQHHPLSDTPDPADLERLTELFKALSDLTRLQLVLLLLTQERSVSALTAALGQPQSTISRHLALLRGAALVKTRREAVHVYYRLADAHLAQLIQQALSHAQHERLGLPDHPEPETLTGAPE